MPATVSALSSAHCRQSGRRIHRHACRIATFPQQNGQRIVGKVQGEHHELRKETHHQDTVRTRTHALDVYEVVPRQQGRDRSTATTTAHPCCRRLNAGGAPPEGSRAADARLKGVPQGRHPPALEQEADHLAVIVVIDRHCSAPERGTRRCGAESQPAASGRPSRGAHVSEGLMAFPNKECARGSAGSQATAAGGIARATTTRHLNSDLHISYTVR